MSEREFIFQSKLSIDRLLKVGKQNSFPLNISLWSIILIELIPFEKWFLKISENFGAWPSVIIKIFLTKGANFKIEPTQYSISFLDSKRVFNELWEEYDFSFSKKKALFCFRSGSLPFTHVMTTSIGISFLIYFMI